jgi:hypothetical protein
VTRFGFHALTPSSSTFMNPFGLGGVCPCCDEPVTIDGLLNPWPSPKNTGATGRANAPAIQREQPPDPKEGSFGVHPSAASH